MSNELDIVVLSRPGTDPRPDVLAAIRNQLNVNVTLHRVVGAARDTDSSRWQTIARARNVGRVLGESPWVMFVDDDVVLEPGCAVQLLQELREMPAFVARAADYLGERSKKGATHHVGMGATLFRRHALAEVEFRHEDAKCECQCMTDDLRRRFMGIEYSVTAKARHSRKERGGEQKCGSNTGSLPDVTVTSNGSSAQLPILDGHVLVAFDRAHLGLFCGRFLAGLRRTGNLNVVHAITYGLREKHVKYLRSVHGVQVYPQPHSALRVCRNRMLGFQFALRKICPQSPVAYWDAGDVLFQRSLEPLWNEIRSMPRKLLVTEEPLSYSGNTGHQIWVKSIIKPSVRQQVFALLSEKPVVNGGFIGGTAERLLEYMTGADREIVGRLRGAGGGDQVVLNVCRYEQPDAFHITSDTWNYCLCGRSGRDCKVQQGKYVDTRSNQVVAVVHGNAATLV